MELIKVAQEAARGTTRALPVPVRAAVARSFFRRKGRRLAHFHSPAIRPVDHSPVRPPSGPVPDVIARRGGRDLLDDDDRVPWSTRSGDPDQFFAVLECSPIVAPQQYSCGRKARRISRRSRPARQLRDKFSRCASPPTASANSGRGEVASPQSAISRQTPQLCVEVEEFGGLVEGGAPARRRFRAPSRLCRPFRP